MYQHSYIILSVATHASNFLTYIAQLMIVTASALHQIFDSTEHNY